jgi:hypothetical protein
MFILDDNPGPEHCYRTLEKGGTLHGENEAWWMCWNDHTGCIYNDGHNQCMAGGKSNSPLENPDGDEDKE